MPTTRQVAIQRLNNGPGLRERFYVQPGRRYGAWIWFEPEEVPLFEGPQAMFEIERCQNRWVVVRAVP